MHITEGGVQVCAVSTDTNVPIGGANHFAKEQLEDRHSKQGFSYSTVKNGNSVTTLRLTCFDD